MVKSFFRKYLGWLPTLVVRLISCVRWKQRDPLSGEELENIKDMLAKDYYLICTRSSNLLSAWFVGLTDLVMTGRFGFYAHCLMNLEDEVMSDDDFRLVEATPKRGVSYDPFNLVFKNVSSVALLKPRTFTIEQWTQVMDKSRTYVGRKYDTLFDFAKDNKLTCIELIRDALQADPNYEVNYANFEALLKKHGKVTPNMLYRCKDFEVYFEVRRS